MNYSHTMSCSNCLQDLTSHHIPQHTSAREEACKACMHITFHTVKWNNHSNQKYSSFIHQLPMKQKTYHAQLQDSEHGPQAKTCTNNESKHVFFKLLQGQMNYSHTMSCSNCLRNLTRHHIPQHTSAREEACKACMHITFHTVALLQGMHAHHISFFQYYLRLQQIQMNLTQWTNCTCFLLPPAYQNKNKTWHPQLHTKDTPQTLYLPHTTQQMSTTTLCLSNVIALSASDRPAKKQLSPKMQKAYVCIYIYIYMTCIRQPRQPKAVESQDAMQVSTQPQLHIMACVNHEGRCLPLCLLPLFGVTGPARHSIGLPFRHSNLPKGRRSSKHWSTLLQLLLPLRICHSPPFIGHMPQRSVHNLWHNKHTIASMRST